MLRRDRCRVQKRQNVIEPPGHVGMDFKMGCTFQECFHAQRASVEGQPFPGTLAGNLQDFVCGAVAGGIAAHEFRDHLTQVINVAGAFVVVAAPLIVHARHDHALAKALRAVGDVFPG